MQQSIGGGAEAVLSIASGDTSLMSIILSVLIIALSGVNAMALKVSQGGLFHTIWFNMAILLGIGGIVVYGVDMFLDGMIGDLLDITETLEVSAGVDK
jgi:flagellar protein FlaJ